MDQFLTPWAHFGVENDYRISNTLIKCFNCFSQLSRYFKHKLFVYYIDGAKKCLSCFSKHMEWLIGGGLITETLHYRPPCPVPPYQDLWEFSWSGAAAAALCHRHDFDLFVLINCHLRIRKTFIDFELCVFVRDRHIFVKLRSWSRSGEGQVRVRRVRFGPELYNIFGFHPPTHHHTNFFLGF